MKTITTFFSLAILLLHTAIANGQHLFIDTAKQNYINTQKGLYPEISWLIEVHDSSEWHNKPADDEEQYESDENGYQLPRKRIFKLDTISKQEFINHKKKYTVTLDTNSSILSRTDTSFIIKTDKIPLTFVANEKDYGFFEYYSGFLKPLNLYLIHSIDGHNEIGSLELIDKKTGKMYVFPSPSDYPIESISTSPKNSYLYAYVNDMYDDNCYSFVLKVNTAKKSYTLESLYNLNLYKTSINEVVWINETSFVFEATSGYSDEQNPLPSHFIKVSFQK